MKKLIYYTIILLIVAGCGGEATHQHNHGHDHGHDHGDHSGNYLGTHIHAEGAVAATQLEQLLSDKERIDVKLTGEITACCQHSGCWMDVRISDDQVMNVTFKDGEFTVPKDVTGKTVVMDGTAYKELVPVERLKAYAKDEGKSQEEIDAITEPGYEYTFLAHGIIIEE